MTVFMDKFNETQEAVRADQEASRSIIVGLLEHIGRGLDETSQMPSQEALGEMQDAQMFKQKNLATAQRTMESLQAEKRKRERDLDLLRISEPKLKKELDGLQESMKRMERDMEVRVTSVFRWI
jgi:predicted  nucleic acid-binding Zn-ribbon protein